MFYYKKSLLLALFTTLSIFCIYCISATTNGNSGILTMGSFTIPIVSLQGIIAAVNALCCIIMVFIDFKKGSKIAFTIMGISIALALIPIFTVHSLAPLPGIVSNIVSLVSIIIIYSFYKRSSMNSLTDFITGLPNRRYYVKEVNERLSVKQTFYLACIEIEDFKNINDVYGIRAADFILVDTAKKLKGKLGENEMLFRITGGLFAMLLNEKTVPEEKLKNVIRSEVMMLPPKEGEDLLVKNSCIVSLAAGIVHIGSNDNYKDSASVMRDAEIALMEARKLQNQKMCLFSDSLKKQDFEQKEAEFLIKDAMQNNYFYLVYQPQFTTNEKKLRGFETLIRCKKPDGSIISPANFIPAAEKTNLITSIDDYVLRRAMTEFKPVVVNEKKDFVLSINVSAKNIGTENFAQKLKQIIDEIQFPPENLEIEITEYSFAESMETTVENILSLKSLGVQIALDDFGTGYTSIAQLMKLPVTLLKIDKSLIDNIETDPVMCDMVDSVIYMGHIMNCEVISEGVENENQLEILKEHKCDFIQGFVWGKPLDFDSAVSLCKDTK
ncbi:diguanylate cyclase (GGDEF) domain-containing protein [Treponema bryantii]|uniref:Diguanylate cyclase (GGDEF) domain-containing protein n=1 Tax=Treponema bryantii TaxID=163 RepID=A0A1H9CAH8_9SPIR|nr:bifunctional diguanylate cyclase/phosphodiesterase [Treponema bryantii]SEP98162.1 diguanylate cyclase (GGDEF) domain-containing protein [Treponema bryantii]